MVFRTKKRRTNIKKRVKKTRRCKSKSYKLLGGNDLPNTTSLTMLTLNCGELTAIKKLHELSELINIEGLFSKQWSYELRGTLPDVIVLCLQETSLAVHNAIAQTILEKGYEQKDYNEQGQGTLGIITVTLFSKPDIKAHVIPVLRKEFGIFNDSNGKCGNTLVNIHNPKKFVKGFFKGFAKGYAALKCSIGGKYYTFISTHLPVFSGIELPNNCLKKMIRQLKSDDESCIFLAGDLNYRTVAKKKIESWQREKVKHFSCKPTTTFNEQKEIIDDDELINLGNYKERLKKDTLMKQTELFKELTLTESPIKFCETCRRKEGRSLENIDKYDDEKGPSWCDRILYDNHFHKQVIPGIYNSFHLSSETDHDAVYHHFELNHHIPATATTSPKRKSHSPNFTEFNLDDEYNLGDSLPV